MSEVTERERLLKMLYLHDLRAEQESIAGKQDFLFGGVNRQAPHWGPQYFDTQWTVESVLANSQQVDGDPGSNPYSPTTTPKQNKWLDIGASGLITWKTNAYGTYRVTARAECTFDVESQYNVGNGWDYEHYSSIEMYFETGAGRVGIGTQHTLEWWRIPSVRRAGNQYFQLHLEHILTIPRPGKSVFNSTQFTMPSIQLRLFNNFQQLSPTYNDMDDVQIDGIQIVVERMHRAQEKAEAF